MKKRWRLVVLLSLAIAALIVGIVFFFKTRSPSLPRPGSKLYLEMVSAFSTGVAALDADANDMAKTSLTRATQLVPEEPAAWADLGLVEIRLGNTDAAASDLAKAQALAPESGEIESLLSLLASRQGQLAEAITHLRRAIELNPKDLRSRFALGQELERQGDGDIDALHEMGEILKSQPDNLVVLIDRARLAAKTGNAEVLADTIKRLSLVSDAWPPKAREQYRLLAEAGTAKNIRLTTTRVLVLRNLLVSTPAFRQSIDAVQMPVGVVGEPLEQFLRLEKPTPLASPPDTAISFTVEPLGGANPSPANALISFPMGKDGVPVLFVADGREIRRADGAGIIATFPGGSAMTPPSPEGIAAADWTSDSVLDLVLAGAGGIRLIRQKEDSTFEDVSAATGLKSEVLNVDAFGVWVADIEMDGDLDVVVGARKGATRILRNHGNGTFEVASPFADSHDLRGLVWADLDRDGDPDAALLDEKGRLQVFSNERSGQFRERPIPKDLGRVIALTIADANGDGAIDVVVLKSDGAILRLSDREEGHSWETEELARWAGEIDEDIRLAFADLDNNGGFDLIGSTRKITKVWLGDETGRLRLLSSPLDFRVFASTDLNGDGRLDLAGLSVDGRPVRGIGRGNKPYHWQVIRPRAAKVVGDGRINSFGLGGEVEVRSGLLIQKQVIAGPSLHFGLGDHPEADVARILWPNGTVQAEFQSKADRTIVAEQRLKGSCPFVYAFDGSGMHFVTDFLWRSPLGLRINAQDTAGVSQTEDWVKIRGDQLVPRDGFYDIRLTAELWETHYWDHVSLMVIDHPEGTEVYLDERFARRPPPLMVHPTGPPRPVSLAIDDRGQDVTDLIRARDGRYLDTFGRGFYQGITRDHWVEVEIGEEVPKNQKFWLVAQGWIHPTDSSINVALGQGRHEPPQGLVLEVPTKEGGWVAARTDLGFPAGKNKTILIDLDGVFLPGTPRRIRLRTNLEIFWDSLALASAEDKTPMKTQRLAPSSADLRSRGYSLMTQADASSPELPQYDKLIGTSQRWNDLIGLYTRFGDVRELLETVDDRYVIVNAGDEVAFRFPAPAPPPQGWVRDFALIGDGWNKDGDYNTAYSKTVLPLPSHDRPNYDVPPGDLNDDPVYQRYPRDWDEYHTRPINPQVFQNRLKPGHLHRQ